MAEEDKIADLEAQLRAQLENSLKNTTAQLKLIAKVNTLTELIFSLVPEEARADLRKAFEREHAREWERVVLAIGDKSPEAADFLGVPDPPDEEPPQNSG